jgi:hypothetical protein
MTASKRRSTHNLFSDLVAQRHCSGGGRWAAAAVGGGGKQRAAGGCKASTGGHDRGSRHAPAAFPGSANAGAKHAAAPSMVAANLLLMEDMVVAARFRLAHGFFWRRV